MGKVQNYQGLIVWQKAMDLVLMIYEITRFFPKDELYGLTSQIRRAAISIPSNIAEGQARKSTAEFLRFLSIANGSKAEIETQLIIAQRLAYISKEMQEKIFLKTQEISKLLHGLINSLK